MSTDIFEDGTWLWFALALALLLLALLGQPHVKPGDLMEPAFWSESAGRAIANLIQNHPQK